MDPSFWHERWEQGQIGFHQSEVHPDLRAHADWLLGGGDQRVLVPLCGKSLDVDFIARGGDSVVGIELSSIAVAQLFEEAGRRPFVSRHKGLEIWEDERITVLCGDIFEVTPDVVGRIDRVWDRAALIALTASQRQRYAAQLRALTVPGARMLLNTLVYGDCDKQGPPHSVDENEVGHLYRGAGVELFSRTDLSAEIRDEWRELGMTWMSSHLYRIVLQGDAA